MSTSTTRRIILPVGIILVAILLTVVLVKIRPKPMRQRPAAPRPLVEAFTIAESSQPVQVRGFGTVRAKRKVNITPQVSGEIIEKSAAFEPGGTFAEGDVLLKIDDTDYAQAVAQAKANVAQAEYSLALAEEEAQVAQDAWKRVDGDGLLGTNDGSGNSGRPTALVLHEPQLKLARANLESARAALRQARVNLGRCTLTAPFDGAVLTADADQGQYLRTGTAIGIILATDVAEITVSVPDDDLAWIGLREGACPAGLATTVAVNAEFAGAKHQWEGCAVRLGGVVNDRSRLVPVVVEVKDPYAMAGSRPPLLEGMFVEVTFSAQAPADAVIIPRSALRPGNEVWVIRPNSTLEIRPVELSRAGVEEAVISSGLAIGERICISNLQFVTADLPVRVEGDPKPTGGDASGKGGER
ncbi:MAG: efflux RND transporter periplasmic adaptor subunit [Gemmatimonadales bacterium]|nr:efflux RND transporter periplasmic adaptor subunit [Gemmatimonadales bacterium]